MAKKLVKNYVFNPGLGLDDNARPDAYSLISQNKVFLQAEINAYIQNQIDAGNPDYVGYIFDVDKCTRDSGYVIDGLLFDLRYGGNEETRRVSSLYWNEDVPQIDGSRIPEYEAYQFLRDTINTNIITNVLDESPEQGVATQVVDETKTSEDGTSARVTSLLNSLVSVIQNGLNGLPDLEVGLGRIELLGKVNLEELLIITNTTDNIVIYNFAEPTKGGEVTFTAGNSLSYPRADQVNEGTTVINFKFDTSAMSSTDNVQVFLEQTELKVRPYDFGTDALERMRVGLPQAMIDADFEYGLQPTKWQAIGTLRGYPSTYEIPASEIPVISVTTDASTGTSGVGASLITVTTTAPHGLEAGGIVTIRALASSIIGFNRAEGTFLIYSVPSTTTFTYYAKSKVGTSSGQVLATSTTQLRKADFYTGASIGIPTFTVASNGSSGSFNTPLIVPSGSTVLAFSGTVPPNGAPLSGTGIVTGTQISGINGSVGGAFAQYYIKDAVTSGDTSITVTTTAGISANMCLADDHDDSTTPSQVVITSIVSDTLNLSGSINANYDGDVEDYTGVVINTSNNVVGSGSGSTWRVTVNAGSYDLVEQFDSGSGYVIGDTIRILGSDVGGVDVTNDIYINVTETTTDTGEDSAVVGAITQFEVIGTPTGSGTNTYSDVGGSTVANPFATNGQLTITRNGGVYSAGITDGGSGFNVGNRFLITGDNLGGIAPGNNATVTVNNASGGELQGVDMSGTAARGQRIDVYSSVNISQATDAEIGISETISYSSIATIQVEFNSNHGILPGSSIMVSVTSDDGSNNHELASGPFFVDEVPALNQIRYIVRSPGNVDVSTDDIDGSVYIRPDSFFVHRPFDGGVQLGTGGPQHGAQAIRQSKKYIRYQSGKGAMYNTGALFAPSYDIQSATAASTASGSLITVVTDDADHGLQAGARIRLSGIKTVGYDGDYTVNEIVDERTFKITAQTTLGAVNATIGSQCQMSTLNWHGAVVRSGPFDDQNGIFFQYDGQEISVVRRTATFQCAGTIAIDSEGNTVTGTNTRFLDQLQEGDRIVIRGMTHVVTNIASATSMTVTPDFRGVDNLSGVKISKVQDTIIPQSEWNLDKCDGTGPSGYNIDITKMQMIGIQFSWYGAGFIDWMFRGANGDYVFCHRLKGNNLNTEAYMRTGNLPVRYEVTNEGARSRLNGSIDSGISTITLDDTYEFPETGTVYIDNEIITYTGKDDDNNQLTGASRAANLSNFAAGASRTYTAGSAASHDDEQGVVLISSSTSPIISHWGSAYMIDGLFDEDRGYIFSYTESELEVSTTQQTAFLLRLAPSVSNAVTGDLGQRELLNRAQLLLKSIEITSAGTDADNTDAIIYGGIVIEGIINPQNYPSNPNSVVWSGLSGLAQGGQPSFAQVASGGAINWGAASSTTSNITVESDLTTQLTNLFSVTNSRDFRVYESELVTVMGTSDPNYIIGMELGSPFPGGTTVERFTGTFSSGGTYFRYRASASAVGTLGSGASFNIIFRTGTTNRNFAFINKTSFDSTSGTLGTPVTGSSDVTFSSNTSISNIEILQHGASTEYYRLTFNNSYSGTLTQGSSTIELTFETPAYAQPGETVFSFIAQPGELASLNLSELKELTNTTIGGRGAFPNGPDVLAINVYKTSGATTDANVILRWGEAQA